MTLQDMYNALQGVDDRDEQDRLLEHHGWDRRVYDSSVAACPFLFPTPQCIVDLEEEQARYQTSFGQCTNERNAKDWNALMEHERSPGAWGLPDNG